MGATFISALVIKHNNDVYQTPDLVVGKTMLIPTPGSGAVLDGDFYAVPINDNIVDGFNFEPTTAGNTTPPNAQSFHVVRLMSRFGNDIWYVRGTSVEYTAAAADAECCAADPAAMPTTVPALAPCQVMCEWDTNSKYFATFALPSLTGNLRYYPYGYFNNAALFTAASTGYATKAALLAFLNSAWTSVGVWSWADVGETTLKVTQAAGSGSDTVCVLFDTVNPSV